MSDRVHSIVNPLCVFDHLVSHHHILVIDNRFRKKLRCRVWFGFVCFVWLFKYHLFVYEYLSTVCLHPSCKALWVSENNLYILCYYYYYYYYYYYNVYCYYYALCPLDILSTCVCKVRLGLTLGVSALSVLFYIAYPITRTTYKSKLLIVPQNVQKEICRGRSSRTRAHLLWRTCSALPHHMYTPVRSCVSHLTVVAPRSTWLVDAFW